MRSSCGRGKLEEQINLAFHRFFFALWLQALGSDTLLLEFSPHFFCLLAYDMIGDAQRRGCKVSKGHGGKKLTSALRAVSLGYWKRFEDWIQYCKCLVVVPSTQPRIFEHTAGMDAFFSILLQLQNELFSLHMLHIMFQKCPLPAYSHPSHASLDLLCIA